MTLHDDVPLGGEMFPRPRVRKGLTRRVGLKPGKPLKRKTPLLAKALRRGTKRLRAVSPTNKRWNAPGRARPNEPLAERCEAVIPGVCSGRPSDRHHIIPRGPGSSDDASNTMDVCRACHRHIEANREWARSVGFLHRWSA